jgi:uncharacterized protein YndB with AHSA1/START domain
LKNAGTMSKLLVDKSIEIDAPASKVWEVLTARSYTSNWAPEFNGGSPFLVESAWMPGSPVVWKDTEDRIIVEGNVTALDPPKLLRFTVFDVRSERPPVKEEDGITYELTEKTGKTRLHILQGDFSAMPEGEKYRDLSAEIWDPVLSKVKELVEWRK